MSTMSRNVSIAWAMFMAVFLAALVAFPAQAQAQELAAANPQAQEAPSVAMQAQATKTAYSMKSGAYVIRSAYSSSIVIDTPDFSRKAGVRMQVWKANGSLAQRMYIRHVAKGTYTIQSVCSGLYLTDKSGKVTQQKRTGKAAQRWKAYSVAGKVEFVNKATGRTLALAGKGKTPGTKLSTYKKSSKAARFTLKAQPLIPDACYEVRSASGILLDVANGSLKNGANVQVWKSNGSAAQVWRFEALGDGTYKIIGDNAGKALEVKGGSKANGANVRQRTYTGAANQRWRAVMREDGRIQFVNKKSGKALDAVSGGKLAGGNVRQATAKATKAGQGWRLVPVDSRRISGDIELDSYIRSVASRNNHDLRRCFDWAMNDITALSAIDDVVLEDGIVGDGTMRKYARYAMSTGKGDCYVCAATFAYLARACGYESAFRAGHVPSAGGPEEHGWTEIYVDGETYVCDVSLGRVHTSRNWYMVSYADAPVEYLL